MFTISVTPEKCLLELDENTSQHKVKKCINSTFGAGQVAREVRGGGGGAGGVGRGRARRARMFASRMKRPRSFGLGVSENGHSAVEWSSGQSIHIGFVTVYTPVAIFTFTFGELSNTDYWGRLGGLRGPT